MCQYKLKLDDICKLTEKELYLFDMDGTIYNGDILFDGVIDLFKNMKESNKQYIFLTNNSSKSVDIYVNKLRNFGIDVEKDNFFTSTQATILYLKNKLNYSNELIYVIGTNAFKEELKNANLNITDKVEDNVKIVLMGYDTELNYQKLIDASYLLTKDVIYIATNPDLVCPTAFGFVPDCGSVSTMLYNATGKKPIFIGKPKPDMIEIILNKYQIDKSKALIIGDRLYTDIASGINAKVDTVCVLSGETTLEQLQNTEYKPAYIIESVKDLNVLFDKN